jgi:hypothetical protein
MPVECFNKVKEREERPFIPGVGGEMASGGENAREVRSEIG